MKFSVSASTAIIHIVPIHIAVYRYQIKVSRKIILRAVEAMCNNFKAHSHFLLLVTGNVDVKLNSCKIDIETTINLHPIQQKWVYSGLILQFVIRHVEFVQSLTFLNHRAIDFRLIHYKHNHIIS